MIEFINKVDESCHVFETNYDRISEIKSKSTTTLIILVTNEYLQSDQLRGDFECAKSERKLILPVILGDINQENTFIDFNTFHVTKLVQPLSSELNIESLKRFQIFLNQALQIESITHSDNWSDLKLISIKKNDELLIFNQNIISNEERIKSCGEKLFEILNVKTGECISSINIGIEIGTILYCWIDHLQQVIILEAFYSDALDDERNAWAAFYDKTGLFICLTSLGFKTRWINSIYYNRKNKKSYISIMHEYFCKIITLDENFLPESEKIIETENMIRITEKYIYTWIYSYPRQFFIYDLSVNFIAKFAIPYDIKTIIDDRNNSNYIFIQTDANVLIFNTNNFSFIGFIKKPFTLQAVFNNTMYFLDTTNVLYCYKIRLEKTNDLFDPKYICKINPLSPHLYLNPYSLPCGNSICLHCIWKNFILYKGTISCQFDTCRLEHKLPHYLKVDTVMNKDMNENFKEILETMFEKGRNVTYLKGDKKINL